MAFNSLVSLTDAQAGWGTISYQSPSAGSPYTFTGLRDFRITGEQIWDDAGRAVIFTRYMLTVHCFVVDANLSAHNTQMTTVRQQLEEAGGTLIISGTGIGDIQINGAGGVLDVEWGPKPQGLEILQIGVVGTEMTWRCQFSVKEGSSATAPYLAFNYGVEWDYDDGGVGTRTITGYLQIPMTRPAGAANPVGSADAYRSLITCAVPPGMQRIHPKINLSPDRRRLDFLFVDKQLEAESPPVYGDSGAAVLECALDYEIENTDQMNFASWYATLSGPITVPRGTQPVVAAQTFMRILLDKYDKLQKASVNSTVILTRLRMGRTMTTRQSHFFAQFLIAGCMDDLITKGGLWIPLDGGSYYDAWANYLRQQGIWSNSGTSSLFYNPTEDALIDLNNSTPNQQLAIGRGIGNSPMPFPSANPVSFATKFGNQKWIAYQNTVQPFREQQTSRHYVATANVSPSSLFSGVFPDGGGAQFEPVQGPFTGTTQIQGLPREAVKMYGKGLYAGQPNNQPATPSLVTYNGKQTLQHRIKIDGPTAVGCIFGATIYMLRWAMVYHLTNYASGTPVMANPMLCCSNQNYDSKGNKGTT